MCFGRSGFSGILDLADKSDESGQAQFFTTEFFDKWSNHLFNQHHIKINNKEGEHEQLFITWRVVAGVSHCTIRIDSRRQRLINFFFSCVSVIILVMLLSDTSLK